MAICVTREYACCSTYMLAAISSPRHQCDLSARCRVAELNQTECGEHGPQREISKERGEVVNRVQQSERPGQQLTGLPSQPPCGNFFVQKQNRNHRDHVVVVEAPWEQQQSHEQRERDD